MTGFDSVIHAVSPPLLGIADFPSPNPRTIIANRNFLGARFQRVKNTVRGFALAPAFA